MDSYEKMVTLAHRLHEAGMKSTVDDIFHASMTLSHLLTDASKAQIDEICGLSAEGNLTTTDDARAAMRTIDDAARTMDIEPFFDDPDAMDDDAVRAAAAAYTMTTFKHR